MKKPIIPHSRPTIGQAEIDAVSKVIASGHIAQGQEVAAFEEEFARKMGVNHAAAVSSGTAALHLALLALDVSSGDEVVIPSYVCTALLNAVKYTGATPIIADIDLQTLNIDPQDVAAKISSATKVIIVPHMFGLIADLENLSKLGVPLIEDCAQATGASHNGKMAGSMGTVGIYSFYATKMMTCGEGGMVVSGDSAIIKRIKDFREYDHQDLYRVRYNYKMTDIQAAMGRQQLGHLDNFIARRKAIAGQYHAAFDNLPLDLPSKDVDHIYYRYNLQVKRDVGGWIAQMQTGGISCAQPVFKPLHQYLAGPPCPRTDRVHEHTLSVPIYPTLSETETQATINAILHVQNGMK